MKLLLLLVVVWKFWLFFRKLVVIRLWSWYGVIELVVILVWKVGLIVVVDLLKVGLVW